MAAVNQLMAAETSWTFPVLEGIVEAPTMRLDGSILSKPGYDEETGLYYDSRNMPPMLPVLEKPSGDDAMASLAVLYDIIDEFPFADEDERIPPLETQSCSVMVSAILTGVVRPALPIAPALLVDAPDRSNGKTLLADCIAVVATGRGAGATQWSGDSAEQRKVISSILSAGDTVINFDNVTAPIGGPAICAVMTAQDGFKDRLLGSTKMLDLPTRVMWIFTGNNMVVRDDMATRVLRIRLDSRCEFPELRVFKRSNLLDYIKSRRGEVIHAALTILKAYIVAGKPRVSLAGKPFKISGRFNEWGDLIAGALVWLGRPDPLASQLGVVADDPVRETRQEVLAAWQRQFGFDVWVTAKQLKDADLDNELSEALDGLEIGGSGNSPNAMATKLKTLEGIVMSGAKLVRRKAATNQPTTWQLLDVRSHGVAVVDPADVEIVPAVVEMATAVVEMETADEFADLM